MNSLFLGNHSLFVNGSRLSAVDSAPAPSLPPFTIRLKFTEGVTPTFEFGTGVQVSSSPNIWDLTYENTNWSSLLSNQSTLIEVIGANTSGVQRMRYMFRNCSSLTTVPLFDTSSVDSMRSMFSVCSSLRFIPLFDTSNAIDMDGTFYFCTNVESGALALYKKASSQAAVPSHITTFTKCGSNTITGLAELNQIPDDWK